MANDHELKIRIAADLSQLKSDLQRVRGDLSRFANDTARAGKASGSGFSGLGSDLQSIRQKLLGLISVAAALQIAFKGIGLADEFKNVQSRLTLVTESTQDYLRVQDQLYAVAQRTRGPFAEIINLYAGMAQATEGLNVSQNTLVRITETVNKAIALTPTSMEASKASLVQFVQAISGDFKSGAQELNSILEQTPGLAIAIAHGLGVTTGELKRLGNEGELSTQKVLNALIKVGDEVDRQFATKMQTVSQSLTKVRNSALVAMGSLDAATGATAALSKVLDDFSKTMDSGDFQAGFLGSLAEMRVALNETVQEFKKLNTETNGFLGDLLRNTEKVFGEIGDGLKHIPLNVRTFIQVSTIELLAGFDKLRVYSKAFVADVKAIFTTDTTDNVAARTVKEIKQIDDVRRASLQTIFDEREANVRAGEAAAARYRAERKAARDAATGDSKAEQITGGGKDPRKAPDLKTFEVARAKIEAEIQALDRLFEQNEIKTVTYFKRRLDLQLQALDAEIAGKRQELDKLQADTTDDKDGKQRSKALTDIAVLEQKRVELKAEADYNILKAEKELQDSLVAVRARALSAEGRVVEARKLELESEFKDMLKRMQAEGDTAGVTLIKKLINAELAQTQMSHIEDLIQKAEGRLQRTEDSAQNRVATGDAQPAQAREDIRTIRSATIEQLKKYRVELSKLAVDDAPGARQALDELDSRLESLARDNVTGAARAVMDLRAELGQLQDDFASNATQAGVQSMSDGLYDLISRAKTFGEAVSAMADSFVNALERMAAEMLARQFLTSAFSAFGMPDISAGVHHAGGIAGFAGLSRKVPAFAFAGAPRYHSGGIAGDEVPAILRRGEEVLTTSDPRHRNNLRGGATQSVKVEIVNESQQPIRTENAQASFDADGMVVRIVTRDLQRNGPISGALSRMFGLRRGGG